jgi:cell wall-associated NlpC family hydrolase
MGSDESAQRAAVMACAERWLRTPWHHGAAVLGAGVDCARLLKAVYVGVGVVPDFALDDYPADWMIHRDEERFIKVVERHCARVDAALPGDLALWRYFRTFSHGGIVIGWPWVIHAHRPDRMVTRTNATERPLAGRPVQFWRPRGWA